MKAPTELLRLLSDVVTTTPLEEQGDVLRGLDAVVNLLTARTSLPHAAQWFLDTRTVEGVPDDKDDFWASRVSALAARELRELVPRFVVLYGEHRHCGLVGNTSATWAYSSLALLPEPPDQSLQDSLLAQLFEEVAVRKKGIGFGPSAVCSRALRWAPKDAVLEVHFEHEFPDARLGHCMMRLELDDDEAIQYWPALEDAEYNYVDREVLTETCERLGLHHVLPLQLATFLCVLATATADPKGTWGEIEVSSSSTKETFPTS